MEGGSIHFLAARRSRHAGTGGDTRHGWGAAQPYRLLWVDAYQTPPDLFLLAMLKLKPLPKNDIV
jgi:hypothetical protein